MKSVLITGILGQDGAYLAKFLLKKGYRVFGVYRRLSTPNFWRLHYLDIFNKIELIPADILDSASLSTALKKSQPKEVYNLAAQSFVGVSFDQPLYTSEATGLGTMRILDEIKKFDNKIKFYQASSSEMFGNEKSIKKNEDTQFHPASPYAIAKVFAHHTTNFYKESYGMFCTSGILFNHESPIRGLEFVTRKVTNGIAKISLGIEKTLHLGNLSAVRDWGYAPEYVEGMYLMMKQKRPDNFVLGTDESHSIKELVAEACKIGGVSVKSIISSKENFRINDVKHLQGDYKKARKQLGWKPKTKFKKLIKIMVEEDISRWERWGKREIFPWDAFTSGEDSAFNKKS
ncbi:MAG: GDP-mannose 4,6-dehydratase [Nitrosopumilus sp.]|nr:GDP-mannose 4,6-dehydratase [Nitrosopumilus sp.]